MKKRNLLFLLMAFSFMLMSCNQSSERFFGVYLGEKFNKALAHFEKNGVKVEVSHDRKEDLMLINLLDKQTFYNMDFSKVELRFSHEKLETIRLERYDSKSQTSKMPFGWEPFPADLSFDNLIKELEKKYGKPLKIQDSPSFVVNEKSARSVEFTGNGVVILVRETVSLSESGHYELGYSRQQITRLYVTIQRD